MTPSTLYIGMMSGTSLDGVDGVLVDFANGAIRTIAAAVVPFPAELRAQLMALQASGGPGAVGVIGMALVPCNP